VSLGVLKWLKGFGLYHLVFENSFDHYIHIGWLIDMILWYCAFSAVEIDGMVHGL